VADAAAPEAPAPAPAAAPFVPRGRKLVDAPVIIQMDAAECGAACLVSVLAHHGRHIALEEARRLCGVSRDGTSALQITSGAQHMGLDCEGYSVESADLKDLRLPGILFWGFDHFVVLEGWKGGQWRLMDPALGRRWVGPAEFDRKFTGVCLELKPGEGFVRGGQARSLTAALWRRMAGSRRVVAASAACGLLLAVPAFVLPSLTAVFVDRVLLEGASRWMLAMVAIAGASLVLTATLAALQQVLLAKLEQRLAVIGGASFAAHAFRLPVDFFTHRYPGDIVQRLSSLEEIADTLAGKVAPAAVGLLSSLAFLAAMFAIDVNLALIVVGTVAVISLVLFRSGRSLADHARSLEKDLGNGAGTVASGLGAIETIKSSGRENDLFARIADANARVASSQQSLEGLTAWSMGTADLLATLLASAVVLAFGGWQVMRGDMSIGALVAFQALLVAFMGPVLEISSLGEEIQALRATLARVDDVMRHPVDPLSVPAPAPAPGEGAAPPARGDSIEFRDVSFGYSEAADPLITDFSLEIGPGRRVAIVGMSGSGKSTVAKLAAGLYAPWSGEVLVDGRPLAAIPRHERTSLVASVGQSPFLIEASLRENLTLWDPGVPDEWIREAIDDAGLAQLVDVRGGLGMRIAEGGTNLSGGEAQRVEIARALARRPSILILDEATSALDATTESQLDRALRRRGCACLVIAHRLSTIRDADEIVVLDAGTIVERGSHEELMGLDGTYAEFVRGGGQG
jgi:NHLM bacteriocin system ABC transporter peptidase/ATP-binding protein